MPLALSDPTGLFSLLLSFSLYIFLSFTLSCFRKSLFSSLRPDTTTRKDWGRFHHRKKKCERVVEDGRKHGKKADAPTTLTYLANILWPSRCTGSSARSPWFSKRLFFPNINTSYTFIVCENFVIIISMAFIFLIYRIQWIKKWR